MTLASRAETAFINQVRSTQKEKQDELANRQQRDAQGKDMVGIKLAGLLGIPLQLLRVKVIESDFSRVTYEIKVDDDLEPVVALLLNRPEFDEFGRLIYNGSINYKYEGQAFSDLASFGHVVGLANEEVPQDLYWNWENINSYLEGMEQS